jgi:O-acetyl-ADP-ribose deacetylase (regulator of RNase III)
VLTDASHASDATDPTNSMSMQIQLHSTVLEFVRGDITQQATDAIVNAANQGLAGGGGVDGAIHRRGGPSIMRETQQKYPEGCATGNAVITLAGDLPARFVIHAVGPVYRDGHHGEPQLLASAYRRSLEVSLANGCKSLAFPSLSTGAYRYPVDEAAPIAVRTVADFVRINPGIELVRFVLFDQGTYDAYCRAATALGDVEQQER